MTGMTTLDTLGQGATVTITLPIPAKCLHPNGRGCWQARARVTKKARADAALVASQYRPAKPAKSMTIQAVFFTFRHHDTDNLNGWLKAYLDGLQVERGAGLIENDRGITLLPARQVPTTKGNQRVELRILSAEWE